MNYDLLTPLIGFAFVTSISPGPNNVMLLASGVNFGFRATIPHVFGVSLGHSFLIFMAGLGLAQIFQIWPILNTILKGVSVVYMVWLAWKIAHASAPKQSGSRTASPLTFLQAAAFQWVNPKGIAMAFTAITVYTKGGGITEVAFTAGVFCLTNLLCVTLWAYAGQHVGAWLSSPKRLNIFNWTMAVVLILSLWPILVQ